eukprot:CAMPEP_0183716186 /NCGR_PEP_ID=MMETSP0737-20130205/10179_1 /TAXON_ID=385413 /ORGANISM="Thalassiosira miniscula, Strain CCMP1093" /LENGTH=246 /DNA_ID=CAMNT_0025945411 /DNA_START=117 /DNA_END=854 /DNA_ORIENTATION=-
MAECATQCSHFQLALDCYNDCLQGAESLDNEGTDAALVLQRMGELQMNKLHDYAGATKLFVDALEILRASEDEDDDGNQRIMNLVLLTAQAYTSAKDYENCLDYYEEYIQLLEFHCPENEDLLADTYLAMANIFADMGEESDYELAIEKLLECKEIKQNIYGPEDEQAANVMHTLATVYEKAGDHDKATEALAEALRSFKMKHNKKGTVKVYHELARMKASQAAESDSLSDRLAAIECYKEALKVR